MTCNMHRRPSPRSTPVSTTIASALCNLIKAAKEWRGPFISRLTSPVRRYHENAYHGRKLQVLSGHEHAEHTCGRAVDAVHSLLLVNRRTAAKVCLERQGVYFHCKQPPPDNPRAHGIHMHLPFIFTTA